MIWFLVSIEEEITKGNTLEEVNSNSKLQAWGWSVPSGSLDRNTVVKLNPSNTTQLKGQPKPIGKSEVLGHLIEISLQIAGEPKVADVTSCYEHMGLDGDLQRDL